MADVPEGLKPYTFHKLHLDYSSNDQEALGDCLLCGREGKFSINIEKSTWRCLVCGEEGNQYTFVEALWQQCMEAQKWDEYKGLSADRGLSPETLREWGVVKSVLSGEWLVPGYNTRGEIRQLYRYVKMKDGAKKLLATPTMNHAIHGVNQYDAGKPTVYLCEGPWDGMMLWEVLGSTTPQGSRFVRTKLGKGGMLKDANVLAVPGCSTFHESWKAVFLGKDVYIVYDNDHPRKHNGKMVPSAAYAGVERVSKLLGKGTKQTSFFRWGTKGYDPKQPHGMDIRDYFGQSRGTAAISNFFNKLEPVPEEWKKDKADKLKNQDVKPLPCTKWITVSSQWRKALKWSFGLDATLSVMLASVVSTDIVGDQLWIKVIGPASCGKSTLCEAVSVSKEFVLAKSTIRGFHSGFKTDGGADEDNSLIVQAAGKTLITKDGDTLLQSPNLGQILSEARDIYDKTSRTHYRNKMSKEYTGINMTWLLCGTSSLRSIDSSELGERFLDCVIMEGIDEEMEDEVLMRVVRREDRNISRGKATADNKTTVDKELQKAMQLTGGYVQWLRKNDEQLLANITTPERYLQLIARIGKFVACMRARPSSLQQEAAEREFGARLVSQHLRLAKCLAVVLNRPTVDNKVMERVIKVALDTSRGITYKMCKAILEDGQEEGVEVKLMALLINREDSEVRNLLRFLTEIGVLETFAKKTKGIRSKKRWRLTKRMKTLFEEVHSWEE